MYSLLHTGCRWLLVLYISAMPISKRCITSVVLLHPFWKEVSWILLRCTEN